MRNKRIMRIMAFTMAFIMVLTSSYIPPVRAVAVATAQAATEVKTDSDKPSKAVTIREKKKKSNRKTDIIVKYKDFSKADGTVNKVKSKTSKGKFNQKNSFKKQKISVYEVDSTEDLNSVIDTLENDPNVEYAQPNYALNVQAVPTDSSLSSEWAIYNDGQEVNGYTGRPGVDINTLNAWNLTMGNENVVIGVLDTGMDKEHKDLSENIFTNTSEIPGNGIDDDGNGYVDDVSGWDFLNDDNSIFDSADADSHGTSIGGIIAAGADNGGIVGVAPKVKLLPLKFISGNIGYTSDAIEAIEYAKNMGVKIINCSFGGTDNNPALKSAMESSGILFVCAAGNRGQDTKEKPVYPAAFGLTNILSVGAVDSKGMLPTFTSYGKDVDIAAPGTSILSTLPGNKYGYSSGTSVSAALVSGVAGLVLSYLPGESPKDIRTRILNGAIKSTALKDKVATDGRVDAFAALTGTNQPDDEYVGEGGEGDTLPVEGEGESDSWYTMNEKGSNVERFHYGEGGVNPASGNYSTSCTDMSITAPGFQVNMERTYNSRNQRQTLLGRGWSFGFEGKVTFKDNAVEVNLPDGSSHVFHEQSGSYVGEGTRAGFQKNVSGFDILTTRDQYKYGFDISTHMLAFMEDKNGNRLTLTYESGKLTKITDTAGREYQIDYNSKNLLSSVTDPEGRSVSYDYNSKNLLTKVTDPEGGVLTYDYDDSQYLTKLTDQNGNLFQQLTYSHNLGDSENKVIQTKDGAGETWYYTYDFNARTTTITNQNSKKWTYWFDAAMYTIRVQDPEGKSTVTEYTYQDYNTYYGDVQASIDRYGNRTDYKIDLKTGNILKQTNPDGGSKSFVYDKWNNVTEETNEAGSKTYYIYEADGSRLLEKAQPLNGTAAYSGGNPQDFAVTTYTYYTKNEAKDLFGCYVAGLLKTVTSPAGEVTAYTYNKYGDTASVTDPAGNKTLYTYSKTGRKLTQKTAEGNLTRYDYDRNGLLIRQANPDGGVERTTYDKTGKILLKVSPGEYHGTKDNKDTGEYTGTDGYHYEWYDSGYLKSETDEDGNRTEYQWDSFGNKKQEKKPNDSIYRYEYDALNRLTKTYFRSKTGEAEVLLSENNYTGLSNGNAQTTLTTYGDGDNKTIQVSIKDYAGREVEVRYGDYSRTQTIYNTDGTVQSVIGANGGITYYLYDSLGRVKQVYNPACVEDGATRYSYTAYTYDKSGNVITETKGKDTVLLNAIPDKVYETYSTYEKGLLTKTTDSEGRKAVYSYNGEGKVKEETKYLNSSNVKVSKIDYDFRGNPTATSLAVRKGDLAGNDFSDNEQTDLKTEYTYDLNGNKISYQDTAGNVTTYTYDHLNRPLTESRELKTDDGKVKKVTSSKTYTWDGQTSTETDAQGNTTAYTYDSKGNQIRKTDALGNITQAYYDRMGRKTAIVSPESFEEGKELNKLTHTEFTYDALGRVLVQKETYQKWNLTADFQWEKSWVTIPVHTYRYDTLGNIAAETDALGNTKTMEYNLAGLLERQTDAETKEKGLPYTVFYSYNGLGQKVKESYKGSITTYSYDGIGDLLTTKINGITTQSASYDNLGQTVAIIDGRGNTTTQKWNLLGKVSEVVQPGDATIAAYKTIYQYDKNGNLLKEKDSRGKVTATEYDTLGRAVSQTIGKEAEETGNTADAVTIRKTYDLNGNILSQTDGRGNTSTSEYDALNRMAAKTNEAGQKTTYTYDKNGNLLTEKNYLGNVKKQVYDGINRLVEARDFNGEVIQQILYNDANAQTASLDALHQMTEYIYNKNLQQIGIRDGEGYLSTKEYDTRGNMITQVDGMGNTTRYIYDGANRLLGVTDALGNETAYTYDSAGNLLSQTDGNGNRTTYRYNARNLVMAKADPSEKKDSEESYTYYSDGKLSAKTDRNHVITAYTYDIFGRTTKEDADGEIITSTYDANGNLLSTEDASGTTVREYDTLNRTVSKTVPFIGKSTYSYDLPGSETGTYQEKTTDPKGNVIEKTYDKAGRLWKVKTGGETTVYTYTPNGTKKSILYPNGTTQSYTYDKKNQVVSLINKGSSGNTISSYSYAYDGAGNQLSKTESKGKTESTYDALNRLKTVTEPGGLKTTYTYDKAGNRIAERKEKEDKYSLTQYAYDARNRLTSTLSLDGKETTYTYDGNGNMVSRVTGKAETATGSANSGQGGAGQTDTGTPKVVTGSSINQGSNLPGFGLTIKKGTESGTGAEEITLYTYNHFNQLTQLKEKDTTSTYAYNAQGYRVAKTINGKITRYLYEKDKVVLETDGSGSETAYQVYGTNLLTRRVQGEKAEQYYCLYNAHGDVTGLLDGNGGLAATYDYDAFGNLTGKTGQADNSTTYAGYQWDEETKLYYLNARYYDSTIARFISEDSYTGEKNDPLSLNLYSYGKNNPIIYMDPTGHMAYKNTMVNDGGSYSPPVSQFTKGVADAVVDVGETIVKTVKTVAKTTPKKAVAVTVKVVKTVVDDPLDALNTIGTNVDKEVKNDVKMKSQSYAVGHLVGSILIASGIGKAIGGFAKGLKNLTKVENTVDEVAETSAKAGDEAGSVAASGSNSGGALEGSGRRIDIKNPVLDNARTGSALKNDFLHAFNDIIDNYAGDATKFTLKGGDGVNRSLYQIEGSLNGKSGIFEWIVDPDPTKGVTHRRFIEGVGITGKPNARP